MPTIQLTGTTGLNFNISSDDANATLNRYLLSTLSFTAPPSLDPIAKLLVKDQHELDFPITLTAGGQGNFAVEGTTLGVQLGASASLGLLQGADASAFLSLVSVAGDPSSSGLVSFALTGTLTVGDSATVSDFSFGISKNATVTLTSYYQAAASDTLGDAVQKAVAALTIPHDLDDLRSLPAGAICQVDAAGSLQFTAGLTYSFLNDPLAAASISNLPSFSINATASATLEATATHTSDHTITLARLPNGLLHLSVSLTQTDDLETSLTVSAGVGANIGSTDALGFLLGLINPNAAAEADAIAAQMQNAAQFKADIKSAIQTSLSASLAASLKVALDNSVARNRAFIYAIDLNALDAASQAALQAALKGDFTALTRPGAAFAGITQLDSALTRVATATHTLALHFLGIFNAASISQFIVTSTVDFTSDTHELVLSDETLQVVDNNLDAEKLRKLVLKDITLTLPASANTKDVATPITLAFLDREGSTSPAQLLQFVNVVEALNPSVGAAAQALLNRNLPNYGVCGLSLALSLNPAQCRQLFIGGDGKPFDTPVYIQAICEAEKTILAGLANDPEIGYRLRLFNASAHTWQALQDAGAGANFTPILENLGLSSSQAQAAYTDVITTIWWSTAMADYAKALSKNQSLEGPGKEVVKDSNRGYDEPWMILAAWNLAGKPAAHAQVTSPLLGAPMTQVAGSVPS